MPYDAYPALFVRTAVGARCLAEVMYGTGRTPRSFSGYEQTVGTDGTVRWGWHEMTKGDSGDATVFCTYHGAVQTTHTHFTVTR